MDHNAGQLRSNLSTTIEYIRNEKAEMKIWKYTERENEKSVYL